MASEAPPDVVAAIAAAVDALWPRPLVVRDARALRLPEPNPAPDWRFSGRGWSKHIASRRDRP